MVSYFSIVLTHMRNHIGNKYRNKVLCNIMIAWLLFMLFCFNTYTRVKSDCPFVSSIGDRRTNKNRLRLVQFNAEWLFIDYYSAMNCPGSGCTWHSVEDAETHMKYVADVINKLDPDIINICEVEGCNELTKLQSYLYSGNIMMPYLKMGTDSATGQNVGMLTKINPLVSLYRTEEKANYPVANSSCGSNITGSTTVSKHYITEFEIGGFKVAFISVHLLAIPTDPDRCAKREAQASVIQKVVSSYIEKKYEIVLLGDMNDYDSEVMDINSNKPISKVLDILKGGYLTNVAESIRKDDRFSDWWDSDNNCATNSVKDLSMIDHVLVTPKLLNIISDVFIYHGYGEYCGKWNSDHWPVIVDFLT